MQLSPQDLQELRRAKHLLERPSLAGRITELIGTPLERGFKLLPSNWGKTLDTAVRTSLERALSVAVRSLGDGPSRFSGERFHRVAVLATGAGGGAFGLPGLVVELPVSTTLMLRSIAGIARSEGEELDLLEGRLECLKVFALGGPSPRDDAAETGYFAVRSALAGTVRDAAKYIARQGLSEHGAPVLVRLISAIGSRFGVVVSEKVAAMAVPAIGAAGGAVVNTVFISHFQDIARGHFIVRRLQRSYGDAHIERVYRELGT